MRNQSFSMTSTWNFSLSSAFLAVMGSRLRPQQVMEASPVVKVRLPQWGQTKYFYFFMFPSRNDVGRLPASSFSMGTPNSAERDGSMEMSGHPSPVSLS